MTSSLIPSRPTELHAGRRRQAIGGDNGTLLEADDVRQTVEVVSRFQADTAGEVIQAGQIGQAQPSPAMSRGHAGQRQEAISPNCYGLRSRDSRP